MEHLLQLENVSVLYHEGNGSLQLLEDVSFSMQAASITTIVGESGSGKTTLARSITRLFLRPEFFTASGSIRFRGQELWKLPEEQLRIIRRDHIRYVFQESAQSLNPLTRIETQLRDAAGAKSGSIILTELLHQVGLDNPERILRSFPHELSIGMLQRVTIAMALAPSPQLIIADEPTSALDPPLKFQILDLLVSIKQRFGISVLVITHDTTVPESYADQIVILNSGRIFEIGPRIDFMKTPFHPYSLMLFHKETARQSGLNPPRGPLSSPLDGLPRGCKFQNHCPRVQESCCQQEPPLERVSPERLVRCFYWK
jgi:oligopeptide/dipeptide ABC transporter ATP-binding protein